MIPRLSDWGSDHFGYPFGGELDLNPYDNIHATQYRSPPSRLGDLHTIYQDPAFSCVIYSALKFLNVKSSERGKSLVDIRAHMRRGGFERRCISCSGITAAAGLSGYEISNRNLGGQSNPAKPHLEPH